MHRDFHYYGTFMAARAAGISIGDCFEIAECAEIVDETYNVAGSKFLARKHYVATDERMFYWKPSDWRDYKLVQRTVTAVVNLKMTQKGRRRHEWFNLPWTAFHFLPNLDDVTTRGVGYNGKYLRKITNRQDINYVPNKQLMRPEQRAWSKEEQLICYPDSTLAKKLEKRIIDVINFTNPNQFKTFIDENARTGIYDDFVQNCATGNVFKPRKFVNAFLGVTMHVYADLWAHQGFAGVRSPKMNDVDKRTFEVVDSKSALQHVSKHHSCSKSGYNTAKKLPASHNGHGNAYRFPDYPAYRYRYVRPYGSMEITRNNPEEYAKAYWKMWEIFCIYNKSFWGNGSEPVNSNNPINPNKINKNFFANNMNFLDKAPRNKVLLELITSSPNNICCPVCHGNLVNRFVAPDDDPDFGVIKLVKNRCLALLKQNDPEGDNLAYFSLAARCHLKWVKQELKDKYSEEFNNFVQKNLTYSAASNPNHYPGLWTNGAGWQK